MTQNLNGAPVWGGATLTGTTLKLQGTATAYDDLFTAVNAVKLPGDSPPGWTTYAHGIGGGVAFAVLGFAIGEYVDFTVQSSHSMQLSTVLDVHIHYVTPSNDAGKKIKFQLDVIAAPVNGVFAVPTGSPYSNEATLGAATATTHTLLELADIPGVNTSVSTIYQCRLTRIAASSADYGSDVYVTYIDCHYIKDSIGSETEYTK